MTRLFLLAVTSLMVFGAEAQMGRRYPSERSSYIDPETGYTVTTLTAPEYNDGFPYQTDPMWTADGKYIIFRSSSRWGEPREITLPDGTKRMAGPASQTYFIEESTGEIIQATDFSEGGGGYLARNSNKMFYFKNSGDERIMCVMNLDSLFADSKTGNMRPRSFYETELGKFPASMGRAGGFCIDCTDEWAYISVSREETEADRRKAAQNAAANWVPRADQPVQVAHAYGGYTFDVLDLKGHTPGHLGLYEKEHRLLFSGDHILNKITPNICCWDFDNNYLGYFIENLKKITKLKINITFSAHRALVEDPYKRIEELIAHHARRLEHAREILRDRPSTAYECACLVKWDFLGGYFPDFPTSQKWFASSEMLAHLQALYFDGEVNRNLSDEGHFVYSLK